jgi:hypothetical protein
MGLVLRFICLSADELESQGSLDTCHCWGSSLQKQGLTNLARQDAGDRGSRGEKMKEAVWIKRESVAQIEFLEWTDVLQTVDLSQLNLPVMS